MHLLAAYFIAGVIVFLGLRAGFKKAKLDPKAHDRMWISGLSAPEGLLYAIFFWPFLAVATAVWLLAELFHATGKKEMARREAAEAKRDKTYDHLTLEQKIALLEAETQKKK